METTKNNLSHNEKIFFNNISNYLDTPIYYYGSIQRSDYFVGYSDIDVAIFSNDPKSIILKLQQVLNIDKSEIKKTIYKIHTDNNKIVHGYKINYKNNLHKINSEFSIYTDNDKISILNEHNSKSILPLHISLMITLLKFLYYRLYIIPKAIYYILKRRLMNKTNHHEFVVL